MRAMCSKVKIEVAMVVEKNSVASPTAEIVSLAAKIENAIIKKKRRFRFSLR